MTDIANVWAEMETQPPTDSGTARRRVHADAHVDLNITLTVPGPVRGLALTIADEDIPAGVEPPATREMDHRLTPARQPGRSVLELRLTDPSSNDLFAALANDVATLVAGAEDDGQAVGLWIARITRWQRLLASAPRGLSGERQRGLYAELRFLRDRLIAAVGPEAAVLGWEGPRGGHDFQLAGGSYEVKSAASHQPQVVTISSERQLDETGTDSLHLVHHSLDVHQQAGETLPDIVDHLTQTLAGTPVEDELADRLLDSGYSEVHRRRYGSTGYTVREELYFTVGAGFPRLVEAELPQGVGRVSYDLVVDVCSPFEVPIERALAPLRSRP
jgi:hypothetical protein